MKRIPQKTKVKLAQIFFESVWDKVEDLEDVVYERLDPDCKYGEILCDMFNTDTVLEVLRIGFKAKYGEELKCGMSYEGGKNG